jgi:uncharacterized integral membrane protein (TIGR00697 family)
MTADVHANGTHSASYRFLGIITVLYVTFQLICDVTAAKIISVGPFPVSVTILYFPLTYIFADVLTEVYGYARARQALWTVMLCSFLACMTYQLVVALPPAAGFENNEAYSTVLGQVPRVVLGSFVAMFAGEILNNYVLARMKVFTKGKHLWTRLLGSTVVGQLANTALFYAIALYGVLPDKILLESIITGWLLKCVVEVVLIPVTYWVVARLKEIERVDFFDTNTNFNPFMLR